MEIQKWIVFLILFMEIFTQNLLTVTLSHDRLQANFLNIDAALKNLTQRLAQLGSSQQEIQSAVHTNTRQIKNIKAIVNTQSQTLKRHSMILDQMDDEELPASSAVIRQNNQKPEVQQTISEEIEPAFQETTLVSKQQKNTQERISRGGKRDQGDYIPRQSIEKNTAKKNKNTLEKTYANLKQRILALEKDSLEKQQAITQLKTIVQKYRNKEPESLPRKVSVELLKKSNSKKLIAENKSRSSIQAEVKEESCKSIHNGPEGNNPALTLDSPTIPQSNDVLSKEITALKDNMLEKIRVIEAQYKESQSRAQNIQRTVDILQRSHEMLKYDFDRTSTSWSKNRSNQTQDRLRSQERLRDTPNSVRDFYQEKVLELFNQMDQIKKEYYQIQNKLSREDDATPEEHPNSLKNATDPREKQANGRVVHNLKLDGGQQKRQLNLLKKELIKLREQFQEFAWGVNTNATNEVKTVVIKPNENKEDWKILSTKMYKLKMELQAGLREVENKIASNNDMVVVLNGLEVGIEECRLLMKRKVQQSDYDKGLKRIETRLNNFIMQVYEKQNKEMEADASLVRQPWFCLSCDSQVKNFGNRPQKSPPKERLVGRKVNPESHMVRRNENGKLPSVLK